jgi:hypothetical protein
MMTTWVCCECGTKQISFRESQPAKCIQCGAGSAFLLNIDRRAKEIAKR